MSTKSQYDAFGRRVAKIKQQSKQQGNREKTDAKASHIQYLWDGDNLIEQQRRYADGTLYDTTQWTYEPDSFRPLAQRVIKETDPNQANLAPQLHYIINDHAGSPRELCSEDGHVEWRGKQQLWGEFDSISDGLSNKPERQYLEQAANDPVSCDLRYQGQVYDQETNLYYNRFRYYDPDSCQYLSPDPIGMAGGLRPSSYVHNPMEWVDPLGLAPAQHDWKFGPKEGESEPSWGNLLRKLGGGEPPAGMNNPHAHHIVFKKGRGKKMKAYLEDSKRILEKYDIDWYKGKENFVWAPNKNHSTDAARVVNEALRKADAKIGTKKSITDALSKLGKHFADDTIKTLF
ncbi:RHS repeat-associated core domain-containing protein [uncultured Shewanella sp.]|uniref:RHS repeat-associated core domain-containing protein n=1 Tax=uncultured Shewanella sp. TaxID=173975 RepID=UPI00262F1D82|nr:RHS repeat-associated core domain-containing protein [uncultured Shewanella sp.]